MKKKTYFSLVCIVYPQGRCTRVYKYTNYQHCSYYYILYICIDGRRNWTGTLWQPELSMFVVSYRREKSFFFFPLSGQELLYLTPTGQTFPLSTCLEKGRGVESLCNYTALHEESTQTRHYNMWICRYVWHSIRYHGYPEYCSRFYSNSYLNLWRKKKLS